MPLLVDGPDASLLVTGHIANVNPFARLVASGAEVTAAFHGPDAYVSATIYEGPVEQVPTWNYVALELEGRVRRMDQDGLRALLDGLSARHEERIADGAPWTMDKMPESQLRQMMGAIVGFEMEVLAWRPTFKLSQNKPADERTRVAAGLEAEGSPAIAELMRKLVP